MDKHRKQREQVALLALGLEDATKGIREQCPDSEELAAMIDGRLSKPEQERVLAHLSLCERCHDEWLAIWELCRPQRQARLIRPFFRTRTLSAVGSALAAAACIVIFFALPHRSEKNVVAPMFKGAPPSVMQSTELLREQMDENAEEPPAEAASPPIPAQKIAAAPSSASGITRSQRQPYGTGVDASTSGEYVEEEKPDGVATASQQSRLEQQMDMVSAGAAKEENAKIAAPGITSLKLFCREKNQARSLASLKSQVQQIKIESESDRQIMQRIQGLLDDPSITVRRFCGQIEDLTKDSDN